MPEALDGLLWCQECGNPLLSDGEGYYVHIGKLSLSRLCKLLRDRTITESLADWFINIKLICPDCGREKQPFIKFTKADFVEYVSTKQGALDAAETIKDLFRKE